jgi:hypothetical protein
MQYRLGRKKSKPDSRTLRFRDYFRPLEFVPPPKDENWYGKVSSWNMYGNDQYGSCGMAALGHAQEAWTTYAEGIEAGPTLDQVLNAYNILSPHDDGVDMLTSLKFFAKTGIGGKKIAAYVALEPGNLEQAKLAIQLFGGVYFGLNLPDAITSAPDMLKIHWDVATCGKVGDPNNGHAVWLSGYKSSDFFFFEPITWGQRISMSATAYQDWGEECYAIVSPQWINKVGYSPSGFNLAQLLVDRAAIASV